MRPIASDVAGAPPAHDAAHGGEADVRHTILFSVRNFWFLKHYESIVRRLAERGHRVHIVSDRRDVDGKFPDWMGAIEALAAEFPLVTYDWLPRRQPDVWVGFEYWVRRLADYIRFLDPQFDRAPVLRRRAARHVPRWIRRMIELRWVGQGTLMRLVERLLRSLERAGASIDHLRKMLEVHAPDVVMVSPLISLGSRQSDILRAAKQIGVHTVFAVGSWDNLSSKARIREMPDWVIVWNEVQRREAVEYHGVKSERIIVTGAQCFDQWFGRAPSRSREAFCRELGLPDNRPLVFYVCSSLFRNSPSEAKFVSRWVAAIRSCAHPTLSRASILVRPHPKRGAEWKQTDLGCFENAVVWPPFGQMPLAVAAKANYFDSLYHADAVVGLNTSAQIEGAIVGRPVFTILLPEFWDNQEGTLHFHYLLDEMHGVLWAARSLEEHLAQLERGLADPARAAARNRTFVETFVRPHGLDRPATDVFADAIERLAARPRPPGLRTTGMGLVWARVFAFPLALALRRTARRRAPPLISAAGLRRARHRTRRLVERGVASLRRANTRLQRERRYRRKARERERELAAKRRRKAARLRAERQSQEARCRRLWRHGWDRVGKRVGKVRALAVSAARRAIRRGVRALRRSGRALLLRVVRILRFLRRLPWRALHFGMRLVR